MSCTLYVFEILNHDFLFLVLLVTMGKVLSMGVVLFMIRNSTYHRTQPITELNLSQNSTYHRTYPSVNNPYMLHKAN